jgi:hypothetical protein
LSLLERDRNGVDAGDAGKLIQKRTDTVPRDTLSQLFDKINKMGMSRTTETLSIRCEVKCSFENLITDNTLRIALDDVVLT